SHEQRALSTALHNALSRGRGGIHYSDFTDSGSEASSAPHRLVCTTHQLSSCCTNRVLLLFDATITSIQSPTAQSWTTDASRSSWTEVRRAVLSDRATRTRQR